MTKISQFSTTAGMLFLFQIDKYNVVYASSDINTIVKDLLYTDNDFDSELYSGRIIIIDNNRYEIKQVGGYLNSSTTCDFPDLLRGVKNKYSYVMVLTVEKIG